MPYILSPVIDEKLYSLWNEGKPYSREIINIIDPNKLPPVHMECHSFNPHSLTHLEVSKHVNVQGMSIEKYFNDDYFYGLCHVIRFDHEADFVDSDIKTWVITKEQLMNKLDRKQPDKLLITINNYPLDDYGFHDPKYHLTLNEEAADWLTENPNFKLLGTSWKTTDDSTLHEDKRYRGIHKKIFTQAVILELLELSKVPEGEYFISAFPLRIFNSSESPLTPVLYTKDELTLLFK